jgi:phosphate transport system substrate-binding protein
MLLRFGEILVLNGYSRQKPFHKARVAMAKGRVFWGIWMFFLLGLMPFSAYSRDLITVKGSDTMVLVSQRWAEEYMKVHPDVTIQVTGGGSGTGVAALINGTTDLANASRQIKKEEVESAKRSGHEPKEYRVAMDAIAVVVHRDNPIESLSLRQLMGIYTGHINNWREVGGKDLPIMRYSRESNSGTYLFFKEHVLQDMDYASDCQNLPGTAAVADAVSKDSKGIGYGGVAYFLTRKNLKVLRVSKEDNQKAVDPLDHSNPRNLRIRYEAIWSGSYPLARPLFIYALREPQPILRFSDWVLSREGQKIGMELGYIPLNKAVVEKP